MGKLTETGIRKQIQRLKGLPRGEDRPWGNDSEPGLREELFRMLWRQSESDEEAAKFVDIAMESCKFCPSPAELVELCERTRIEAMQSQEWKSGFEKPDGLCRLCESWGWVKGPDGLFRRCQCPNGHELPQILLDGMNRKPAVPVHREAGQREAEVARMLRDA
jgi:hypothetical protein